MCSSRPSMPPPAPQIQPLAPPRPLPDDPDPAVRGAAEIRARRLKRLRTGSLLSALKIPLKNPKVGP